MTELSTTQQPSGSGTTSQQQQPNDNVNNLQTQVDQVVDIMRVNVSKVLERDQKLSDLDTRAENLADGSRQFQTTAARVKRKYWWQNCKMWLILIGVILVVIIIIIVAIVVSVQNSKSKDDGSPTTKVTPSP
jgi:t-SNARE complex subunit (syntaxin)